MYYYYKVSTQQPYIVSSHQFPDIKGRGQDSEQAFNDFLSKVFGYITNCLKSDIPVPEDASIKREIPKTFGLPLNMALKIKLHNIRVAKSISRKQLSQFLAVRSEDMGDREWNVENLITLSANKIPKYKNVQRLFDLSHASTVREMEAAYRVLGFNVSVVPEER